MTATPLLSLAGVHTHIGAYHILHGVDLDVAAGEVTMLLGRNGAGKTTTLRTIMGLWAASAGSVVFDGRQIGGPAATGADPAARPSAAKSAAQSQLVTPAIVQNLIAALRELKSTQTTILLVEQNFAVAQALGDRVAVMDDGRIVHRGAMAELAADEALQHRLLGLSLAAHQ